MGKGSQESLLEQFVALTGSDRKLGRHLLEASNWNLELALNMHMDNGMQSAVKSKLPVLTEPVPKSESLEQIRAPIAPKREVLVSDYSGAINRMVSWNEQQTLEGQRSTVSKMTRWSIGSAFDNLFRPPFELMFEGNFESARSAAHLQDRWLLVNIQQLTEFNSQILNRDLWSNHDVKQLIKTRLILWQMGHESSDGKRYINFYHVNTFPHLSIIDPRTGEKIIEWNCRQLNTKQFIKEIEEFLKIQSSPSKSKGAANIKFNVNMTDYYLDQSEEHQMRAAIEASLCHQPLKADNVNNFSQKDSWRSYIGAKNDSNLSLMIRYPDGKHESVTLPSDSKLRALFMYIGEKRGDCQIGIKCDLFKTYPKTNLTECDQDRTLDAIGIKPRDTLYLQPK
ncbi:UBX domain-containing protein 7 [Blomia tropicalis]|nr:UBX domain-containing protein 7 [Blomia tropicalis]